MEYKTRREEWGSEYYITEGDFEGCIVEAKVVVTGIYPTDKKNPDGTPVMKLFFQVVSRTKKEEKVKNA